jgi:hypothetical protein
MVTRPRVVNVTMLLISCLVFSLAALASDCRSTLGLFFRRTN